MKSNIAILLFLILTCINPAQGGSGTDPWKPGQVMEPQGLDALLTHSPTKDQKPVILHIGFDFLYKNGHIPNSLYAGPAKDEAGLSRLRKALEKIPRDKEVIIYCGCCPFTKCPNVRPAFELAQKMGFTKVKVLHLNDDFKKDWMDKGYPVVSTH